MCIETTGSRKNGEPASSVTLSLLPSVTIASNVSQFSVLIVVKGKFSTVSVKPQLLLFFFKEKVIPSIADPITRLQGHYDKATCAVLFNSNIGDWFGITVGVRQGYLLLPTLFNIFLEMIMTDALEDHEGTFSI